MKDVHDGAVPSANATAALALARLGELTGAPGYQEVGPPDRPGPGTSPGGQPGVVRRDGGGGRLLVRAATPGGRVIDEPGSGPARTRARYVPDTVLAWGEPFPVAVVGGT